jgi:hypothetical protein
VELLNDVTMVDYEVMTLKRDFDDLLEGIDKRCFSRRFDMLPESHQHLPLDLIFLLELQREH